MRWSSKLPVRYCLTGDRILAADLGELAIGAGHTRAGGAAAVLQFSAAEDGVTHIAKQFAPYPFHVCRPFFVSGDPHGMATVYLQSCAGGIFEHDRLALTVHADPQSKVHVTTSASTIVHSMPSGSAQQAVNLIADGDSQLEYLPDPMILFAGAAIATRINVMLHEGAQVMLSDAFLLHDYNNEGNAFNELRSEILIRDPSNRVLVRDRLHASGITILAALPGVTGRYSAQACFMYLARGATAELVSQLRAELDACDDIYAGVSLLPNGAGLFSRVLATDGVALRAAQHCLWSGIRKYLTGVAPTPRRK
jgi:urease accessory protein